MFQVSPGQRPRTLQLASLQRAVTGLLPALRRIKPARMALITTILANLMDCLAHQSSKMLVGATPQITYRTLVPQKHQSMAWLGPPVSAALTARRTCQMADKGHPHPSQGRRLLQCPTLSIHRVALRPSHPPNRLTIASQATGRSLPSTKKRRASIHQEVRKSSARSWPKPVETLRIQSPQCLQNLTVLQLHRIW